MKGVEGFNWGLRAEGSSCPLQLLPEVGAAELPDTETVHEEIFHLFDVLFDLDQTTELCECFVGSDF